MMREWATVIAWEKGVATLRCEQRSGCSGCRSKSTCGTSILNKLGVEASHDLKVDMKTPLSEGQKVEIGIAEASLLRSALLVYMTPLLGLILGGSLLQWLVASDLAAILGALVGGIAGFFIARQYASHLGENSAYQPIILQIGLPPSALRLQEDSE